MVLNDTSVPTVTFRSTSVVNKVISRQLLSFHLRGGGGFVEPLRNHQRYTNNIHQHGTIVLTNNHTLAICCLGLHAGSSITEDMEHNTALKKYSSPLNFFFSSCYTLKCVLTSLYVMSINLA